MVAITVVLAGVLYVWANSLKADQPESGTRNSLPQQTQQQAFLSR